ncbi:MAG: hypothetical protein WB711_21255 [Terriglobales bacterium]
MKNCKSMLCLLGFALACTVAVVASDGPKLTFTFTKANIPGALQTYTYGINNAGVTVGSYRDKSSGHGYILNGKKLTKLDDPKAQPGSTIAYGLNPSGAISVVGVYSTASGTTVGFLYKNGKYTDIPGPTGTRQSSANSINDSGAIVGSYVDSNDVMHGFLLKDKKYTTLDLPVATEGTGATGINTRGWIVLYGMDSSGAKSALTKNNGKTYKAINVPGSAASFANDLNSAGDIVYEWLDSNHVAHGALLQAGKYYKFDFPKAVFTYSGGINDKSSIVGWYQINNTAPASGFKATYK